VSAFELFLFLFIAMFANTLPAFLLETLKLPLPMRYPIDFHKKLLGHRILGDHKTFIGFLLMVCGALIAWHVLLAVLTLFDEIPAISNPEVFTVPFLIAVGVFAGDATGSFIKRRCGIMPGDNLPVIDNLDWIIGTLLILHVLYGLPPPIAVIGLSFFFFALHVAADRIAIHFHLRRIKPSS
jgi:CDP-2,3-bis-(O-geranylgeranyl)-sn-glycerol synthase